MDEFDDISEEERVLAAKLALRLEGEELSDESLGELEGSLALLQNFKKFELDDEVQQRGHSEVEQWAKEQRSEERQKTDWLRWLYWLPMPAVAAAALFVFLNRSTNQMEHSVATQDAPLAAPWQTDGAERAAARSAEIRQSKAEAPSDESSFEKLSPRYHAGEVPPELLRAQASVLAKREPGNAQEAARAEFDRQMRAYRGQLIASLETAGR